MPGDKSRENGKKGGRPKGSKDPQTLIKEQVQQAINQRVFTIADSLLTPQISLAKGQQFLYKIEKTKRIGPKGGISYQNEKPQIVVDQWEIQNYLDSLIDKINGDIEDETDPAATYYFITAKEPNNMAIDSLFNRALGKPNQSMDLNAKIDLNLTIEQKELIEKNLNDIL